MTFPDRMRLLRTAAHITQDELADIMGYSPNAIQNWERGKSAPNIYAVSRLADFFGVSMDYITGRTNTKRPPD